MVGEKQEVLAHKLEILGGETGRALIKLDCRGGEDAAEVRVALGDDEHIGCELELLSAGDEKRVDGRGILVVVGHHGEVRRLSTLLDVEGGIVLAPELLVKELDEVDDVVEVIEEEREEDILKLGGVDHTDLYESVISTTKSRISWLIVNLMTAVVASIVIGLFEAAIEKVVALAILMPIVASMGANAGTQTLTVAVRAIAVKELTTSNAIKIITKETLIGGINGVIFAIIISLISIYWFESLMLGLIIGLAMILNLLIAGFSGIVIPLVLDKLKIDPALASAVILTTITDVFGFLSFLGLATLFLI